MIGILDYGMGNLRSVYNAIHVNGFDCAVVTGPADIASVTHLIIPGVGMYRTAATRLESAGLREAVLDHASRGKPLLGICLGMEILSESGEEGGPSQGLGLVAGKVVRFDLPAQLRVPHVGWNSVAFAGDHPVFKGVKPGMDYYFVHSYYFDCARRSDVLGTTGYGIEFPSVVGHDNIIGLQFHPEKSQRNGLRLLENFCDWAP